MSLIVLSVRSLSRLQGHSAAGRFISTTNSKDTIGNRFRDLPVNSKVFELSATPRAREKHLQHVNTECEQSAEFVNTETEFTLSCHCALNG